MSQGDDFFSAFIEAVATSWRSGSWTERVITLKPGEYSIRESNHGKEGMEKNEVQRPQLVSREFSSWRRQQLMKFERAP